MRRYLQRYVTHVVDFESHNDHLFARNVMRALKQYIDYTITHLEIILRPNTCD